MPMTEKLAASLTAARERLQAVRAEDLHARQAAQKLAIRAAKQKVPETTIAEALGVDRMTVRTWVGKR